MKSYSGAVNSTHYFGRSMIVRQGRSYYLVWQRAYRVYTLKDAKLLTHIQYHTIKAMLGESYRKIRNHHAWITYHRNPRKCYYRIKKYLIKEELFDGN